jgi:hypothetical protein
MAVNKSVRPLPLLTLGIAVLVSLVINFDAILLHPATQLPGTPNEGAYSLLHVWWPVVSVPQPDDLTIHSFIGAPYLANHLRYTPVLQSILFHLLNFTGPILAFNLLLMASQVATQLVLYGFFRRKGIAWPWAVLASLAFVLSPWYSIVVGQADLIAAGWWLPPLTLIVWDRWTEQPTAWRTAAVVAVLYASILCGVQNIMWVVTLWLPYALWTGRALWRETANDEPGRGTLRDYISVMLLSFLVLFLFYPVPGMVRALQGNEPAYGPAIGLPILRSFIGWILRTSPAIFAATLLTGFVQSQIKALWPWIIIVIISLLTGFGLLPDPINMLAGALGLPYWPLAERSFFFGIALFAMLVYITLTWRDLWQNGITVKWGLVGAMSLIVIVGSNTASIRSIPSHEVSVPAFYTSIAAEPEDYVLLDYPVGLVSLADDRTVGDTAYLAQYAIWHLKRPVSGLSPYYEPHVFDQVQETAFLFPEVLTTQNSRTGAEALGRAVREWRIGYVVVHPDMTSPETQAAIQNLAEQSEALCPPVAQDGLIVYRALWHPFGCETP